MFITGLERINQLSERHAHLCLILIQIDTSVSRDGVTAIESHRPSGYRTFVGQK